MRRLLFVLAPLVIGCSSETEVPVAPGEVTTDAGLYMLHITPSSDTPQAADDFTLSLMLHDASDMSMVGGADVGVEPWMPGMGHGIGETPEVMEMTDSMGMYETTFQFSMVGYWEIEVDVSGEPGDDVVVFAYEVE